MNFDCIPPQQMALLVNGSLPPAEQDLLLGHVVQCGSCYEEYLSLLGFDHAMASDDAEHDADDAAVPPHHEPDVTHSMDDQIDDTAKTSHTTDDPLKSPSTDENHGLIHKAASTIEHVFHHPHSDDANDHHSDQHDNDMQNNHDDHSESDENDYNEITPDY